MSKTFEKKGDYVFADFGILHLLYKMWLTLTSKNKVLMGYYSDNIEDLELIKKLLEEGKVKSIIDKTY